MPNYSGIWTEQAVMQANGAGNWPNAPGAPTIGTATVLGATSVSVAFTAPTFLGIPATITSYTVTSSPGGLTGTGASSPITVAGLTTGTPYTFTVQATNASGTGPASAASNSVTPVQIDYIEDVFSTYLYTGNSSTQTITNGIDLSTKGGLVWVKWRSGLVGSGNHVLVDTSRGVNKFISSNSTAAEATQDTVSAFNTTGFTLTGDGGGKTNYSGDLYASWTFREQPKFFDVVTYTGNGAARTIAHNLGSVPACIIVKATSAANGWAVYHRSLGATKFLYLDTTESAFTQASIWNNTEPTSSVFTVGTASDVNGSGITYVAYLFAHDAGGFGLTGTDNVISCGSFTLTGGTDIIDLGYEPQWLLTKRTNAALNWQLTDNMRGMTVSNSAAYLYPNNSNAETSGGFGLKPTATGISITAGSTGSPGDTFIYIAIRRGPMAVPTSGTSVYTANTYGSGSNPPSFLSTFPVDMMLFKNKASAVDWRNSSRLLQGTQLCTNATLAETTNALNKFDYMNGWHNDTGTNTNVYSWMFRRAPGFFDEVCYTGTGAIRTISHNLTVAPEWIIVKKRSASASWYVYVASLGASKEMILDLTLAEQSDGADLWNSTNPTSSVFTLGADATVNQSSATYVAYLFATCAGVSKVGSYTGTGALQTVNCGFAAGARFVLIKRTDSTGDWWTYDSARGITSSNDPYLFLNSTAAEVTNTNYVDTTAVGFQVTAAAPAGLNASGGTYIFLAIA